MSEPRIIDLLKVKPVEKPKIPIDVRMPNSLRKPEDIQQLLAHLKRVLFDEDIAVPSNLPEVPGYLLLPGATPPYYHLVWKGEGHPYDHGCGRWFNNPSEDNCGNRTVIE